MKIRNPFILIFILSICGALGLTVFSEALSGTRSEITGVKVADVDGTTEIEINSNAPFTYTIFRPADPYQIVIDLQEMDRGNFKDIMKVDRAGVLEIEPAIDESSPNNVKLIISLTVPADIEPVYSNNSLILAFDNPEAQGMAGAEVPAEYGEPYEMAGGPEAMEEVEEPQPGSEGYTGEKISIDFQDAELRHVFRLIADISGYNIIVSPDVKGRFSMKLIEVPWDQALDVILRNYSLSKTIEGNIIRVAPTSVLAKEEEEIARAKESQEKSGDLVTKVYAINYADVEEIKKAIDDAKILTKRGFISVDARTSSVIIKDVEKKHAEHESLINALDIPIPQVSIAAKIVEVRNNIENDLGIQWGVLGTSGGWTVSGVSTIAGGTGFNSSNPLMVNLPAAVGAGSGANMGLGYIAGDFALDLQLSALESTGKLKIISSPKITTSDNEKAKIMQGRKIPYETVSDEGTTTEFVDAFLELTVTPHITPEGTVVMKIDAKNNDADFGQQVKGVPTILVKEVQTQVLINNGDTLVIGGIFTKSTSKNLSGVPGVSDIPVLGGLFTKESEKVDNNELLIFITPRIVSLDE